MDILRDILFVVVLLSMTFFFVSVGICAIVETFYEDDIEKQGEREQLVTENPSFYYRDLKLDNGIICTDFEVTNGVITKIEFENIDE